VYLIKDFFWRLMGYNDSLFDNRHMYHIAGGYMVAHIASLFFKNHYWVACIVVALVKEAFDHWIFGCGSNEIKHLWDILSWGTGGLSYLAIVFLKRKKYGYH